MIRQALNWPVSIVALAALVFAPASWEAGTASARAETITFATAAGSKLSDLPVNANAVFTTSANSISVTLTNLQSDPTSVIQCLSGVKFTISDIPTSASLTDHLTTPRTINSDKTYSDDPNKDVLTGWQLTRPSSSTLMLSGMPRHTLIGDPGTLDTYANANGSLAGNKPHNPFIAGDQTWTIALGFAETLTAPPAISDVTFLFGTGPTTLQAVRIPPTNPVPEPSAVVGLLSMGIVGAVLALRKKFRKG